MADIGNLTFPLQRAKDALRLSKRLRGTIERRSFNVVGKHLTLNDVSILLELYNSDSSAEDGIEKLAAFVSQNRPALTSLAYYSLVKRTDGSDICYALTEHGERALKLVEPLIEEACSYG